ncbi:MAG TPA: four helix bundle protein [Ignavibacteriaceae bacterium]|nr:four helix bundle protein [Ignavibacteriaceae bacterium]
MDEELLNRNKNINRGYRKLEVWKEAIELYVFVTKKVRTLNSVPFKVRAQVEDSIFSVHSNIAEGYSRRSLKEYIQFINISLSSMAENYSQTFALVSSGDIDKEWFDEYDKKHYSLENKLIQMNKTMISKLDKNEWKNDYVIRELVEKYGI